MMKDQKQRLLAPLIVAAATSVISFSGIGVAAITGHLSITHSGLNPFSNFNGTPSSGIIQAPYIATERHEGLTRQRGETRTEGKPVNFRSGARVPARKPVCADCGVVGSITPGLARQPAAGITPAPGTGPQGVAILKVAGSSDQEQDGSSMVAYIVTVKMENGAVRTIYEAERPSFNIGERIKLVNGAVVRLG